MKFISKANIALAITRGYVLISHEKGHPLKASLSCNNLSIPCTVRNIPDEYQDLAGLQWSYWIELDLYPAKSPPVGAG